VPVTVNGETYYTAKEAAEYLGISRDSFYENVRDQITPYKHRALRRVYYRQSDLDRFRGFFPLKEEKPNK
jgi:excisionase family DNA binding protein